MVQSGVKSASAARAESDRAASTPSHATAPKSFEFNRHMGRDTIKTGAIYECGRTRMAIGAAPEIIIAWMDPAPASRPSFPS